jgi:ribonuclease P protein component
MPTVLRIRKRADFLKAKDAKNSVVTAGLVLQVAKNSETNPEDTLRLGFTTSSKLGNAVKRNRIKRRLRAASREVMATCASAGNDYVIIGRTRAFDRDFSGLIKDLKYALHNTGTYQKHK